jgi:hypothetical protein
MDFSEILRLVTANGVGVAFAVAALWFVWYRETKTLPGMTQSFVAAMKTLQEGFSDRDLKLVAFMSDRMREDRRLYELLHEEVKQLMSTVVIEARANRDLIRAIAVKLGTAPVAEDGGGKA